MKRITPKDLIEAAEAVAAITGQSRVFIVGMASTAHSMPSLDAMPTDDVDLFTPDAETCFLDEVIAALGEGSPFEARQGFYIERLGSWVLLTQPSGWMQRALLLAHPTLTIHVLHPLDLLYNKLETARKKDLQGALKMLQSNDMDPADFHAFLKQADKPEETRQQIAARLDKLLAQIPNRGTAPPSA